MGVQTATTLYPVNSTTVDSGTGIDIRLLSTTEAGATDTTQTITLTHSQDNTTRLFDPATAGSAATTLTYGYALRLTEDMTPADDANCDVYFSAQTVVANIRVAVNQSGGTYVTGSYAPEWRALIAAWNPSTNTATTISAVATNSGTSWNYTPATGDLGTFKNIALNVVIPKFEFAPGTILFLMLGLNSLTIPNPTLGTATWTFTLAVDDPNTNIVLATPLASVCGMVGSSSGVGDASGALATVLPTTGSAAGAGTALGVLEADAEMTGTAAGTANALAVLAAIAETTGTSAGSSEAHALLEADAEMTGVSFGTSDALAVLAAVGAQVGSASGSCTVSGVLEADAEMTGSAAGTSEALGSFGAVAETAGTASSAATASGALAAVAPTIGTVDIGGDGSATVVRRRKVFVYDKA